MAEQTVDNQQRKKELDQAFQNVKTKQKEALVIDFDEAKEQYQKENPPIRIKFEGQTYEAPADVTAEVMLFLIDHLEEGEMTDEAALKLLPMIFGDEITAAMKDSKAPFSLISEKILTPVMQYWGFGGAEGYVEDSPDPGKNGKTPGS